MELTEAQVESLRSFLANSTVWWVAGVSALLFTLSSCRIFSRAGFNPALGLLVLVPGVNVVMVLLLAFAPWPKARELRALKKVQKKARKAHNTLERAA